MNKPIIEVIYPTHGIRTGAQVQFDDSSARSVDFP